jgi:hypothetical protein
MPIAGRFLARPGVSNCNPARSCSAAASSLAVTASSSLRTPARTSVTVS